MCLVCSKTQITHVRIRNRSTVDIVESYSILCWQWSLVDLFYCFHSVASIVSMSNALYCMLSTVLHVFIHICSKYNLFSFIQFGCLFLLHFGCSSKYVCISDETNNLFDTVPTTVYQCAAIKRKHEIDNAIDRNTPKIKHIHRQTNRFWIFRRLLNLFVLFFLCVCVDVVSLVFYRLYTHSAFVGSFEMIRHLEVDTYRRKN